MKTIKRDRPGLLDVNVLIALLDPNHQFHDAAHAWFAENRRYGWATCPITENGCVRILGKASYPAIGLNTEQIRAVLTCFTLSGDHSFWPDSITLLDSARFPLAGFGPKQLTDLYLLGLAQHHRGRLVTFDNSIRWNAVAGCTPEDLEALRGTP